VSSGWPVVRLGEVLTERREVPDPADLLDGTIRIVAKIGFADGRIDLRRGGTTRTDMILIRPGDLVVSGINAAKGAIGYFDGSHGEPIAATIHYGAYVPRAERVEPRYLWLFLRSEAFRRLLAREVPGGIKSELRASRLLPLAIPLPSLPEQRRLLGRIEGLAGKVEKAKQLAASSRDLVDGLVSAVVERYLNPAGKTGWTECTLGDHVLDTQYGTSEKSEKGRGGTPVLRMGNIRAGRLDVTHLEYLSLAPAEEQRLLLRRGDILVNRTNSAELVGKCAVFDLPGPYAFASYLIRVRVDEVKADPRLLAFFINGPTARKYLLAHRKQMTGQANINARTLLRLPLALPPRAEQGRLLGLLERVQEEADAVRRAQERRAQELEALLPAILDRAFRGEL
jgi:type I restriction enzyme S subunit